MKCLYCKNLTIFDKNTKLYECACGLNFYKQYLNNKKSFMFSISYNHNNYKLILYFDSTNQLFLYKNNRYIKIINHSNIQISPDFFKKIIKLTQKTYIIQ